MKDTVRFHRTLQVIRYIELNPVRAGMVKDPVDYVWSRYRSNAFGQPANVWSPHPCYLALGNDLESRAKNYRKLFKLTLQPQTLKSIRDALNTGFVLGTDTFKTQVEALTGQPQALMKRGPKNKNTHAGDLE